MKKNICVLLALCFTIACFSTPAAAADSLKAESEQSKAEENSYNEAISNLLGVDAIPDAVVTREDLARRVVSAIRVTLDASFDPEGYTGYSAPLVSDLTLASYKGVVMYVVENKIMGTTGGKFEPQSAATYQEALSAVLRLVGYSDLVYPWGYIEKAVSMGITEQENLKGIGYGDTITQRQLCQLIYEIVPSVHLISVKFETKKSSALSFEIGTSTESAVYINWGNGAAHSIVILDMQAKVPLKSGEQISYYTAQIKPPKEFKGGLVTISTVTDKFTVFNIPNQDVSYLSIGRGENLQLMDCSDNPLVEFHISEGFSSELESPLYFSDLDDGHWAYKNIKLLVFKGIMSGTEKGIFEPESVMTRGSFITSLAAVEGIKGEEAAVKWAADEEILLGYGNGDYGLSDSLTREQMAVIFSRYFNSTGADVVSDVQNSEKFADDEEISSWASDAVALMRSTGIINGKPGNVFDPKGTFTRAEAAAVLARIIDMK